ncbi:MAG: hypothetical protein AVDCRST_MAG59-3755 [uncultured Thermomicrobiales bacterium]|uniref:Uncharacterized protein n=1 Tax=uncultured Thermomicrobiales bacterium TaxID=1645740 RepID=A0A6J4VGM9_9BACT|nr:MAG: hypothetical protein AVDCRST_MAG59-3755 [uncultured Thermomicrobiales bacterium]
MLDEGEAAAGLRGADHEADTEGAEVDEFAVPAADHPRAVGAVEATWRVGFRGWGHRTSPAVLRQGGREA